MSKNYQIGDVLEAVTHTNNRPQLYTINFIDESSIYFESDSGELFTATRRDHYVAPPILRKI
jgi:hypothetical protein